MKVRVLHLAKTAGYAGTEKVAQTFCKYLGKSQRYEPFYLYQDSGDKSRLSEISKFLDAEHLIEYHHKHQINPPSPYWPEEDNFQATLEKIKPDIIHIHRAGIREWPLIQGVIPPGIKVVEHCIFGHVDHSYKVDCRIYICNYIKNKSMAYGGPDGPVLWNPVEPRLWSSYDRTPFLREYNLPENAILLGRVGRPDNFDPISLKAFRVIENKYPNVYYLVVNPCDQWRRVTAELNLKHVIFLDKIVEDMELSRFYSSINILAHCRHDGEVCPTNILEAMAHCLPVVSHKSRIYNGHLEILAGCGIVVPIDDHVAYASCLEELINNKPLRGDLGIKSYNKWLHNSYALNVTQQLETIYDGLGI